MKSITLFIVFFIAFNFIFKTSNAQCSWEAEICLFGCSDWWDHSGEFKICFDPNENSILNPVKIPYCFNTQNEVFRDVFDPFINDFRKRKTRPWIALCRDVDICESNMLIYEVEVNIETGTEVSSNLIGFNNRIVMGNNRLPVCGIPCEPRVDHWSYLSSSHYMNILDNVGKTFKMVLNFKCCETIEDVGNTGEVIGHGQVTFYYQFVNMASNIDINIDFTASQEIEILNGDNDIDGILISDGEFPGPFLGPASAGIRISKVGSGISEYIVELRRVDCSNPTLEILIHSQTIPYTGSDQISYSFLNVPNWENIFDPDHCYKVDVYVKSECTGAYVPYIHDQAYFMITDQCIFCLRDHGGIKNSILDGIQNHHDYQSIKVTDRGYEINLIENNKLKEIVVLDEWGQIVNNSEITNIGGRKVIVNFPYSLNRYSRYYLIVTYFDNGTILKSMQPNLR